LSRLAAQLSFIPAALLLLILLLTGCAGQRSLTPEEIAAAEPDDPSCAYFYFSWGRFAEMAGRLEEAQDAYTKALVCDQHSTYLHQRLAYLLIAMDKKEQAGVQLDKILENSPDDNRARLELAGIFENLGKTDKAIEILKKNISDDPKDNHSRLTLGYLYFRHDRLDEARAALEKHVAQEPDSYSGSVMLARLYRTMGEIELARTMYEKVLGLNWSFLQAVDAAEFYEQIRDYDKAVELYMKLLEEEPDNETCRRKLAGLYMLLGKPEQAVLELEALKKTSQEPEKVDLAIGRLLLEQKKYKDAIHHFGRMLVAYPQMDIIRPLMALAYYEAGDAKGAKKVLAQVPVESKEYEDAILMLVRLYQEEDKLSEAAKILEHALQVSSAQHQSFFYLLAAVYHKNKEIDKGVAVFERAILALPEESRVWFEYGLYMDRIGRQKEALQYMTKVLEIDPDDPYALNYVGYTWADAEINLDQALDYISRAVAARPEDGFVRDSLGWVYYKRGDFKQAVVELTKACELQPDDPTMNEHLGDAYMQTGEFTKAAERYTKAVDLYKDAKQRAIARRKLEEAKEGDR
jgi:tetratricopeptide (TPR) repeat protein